jgi:hypothetical protein
LPRPVLPKKKFPKIKHPFHRGKPLELDDQHGGNWNEWPKEWRAREFPTSFRRATLIASPAA